MGVSGNLTRKDIALAAGVSPSTVSRALSNSDLLPQSTIDHVCQVATNLGYQPNVLARRLATNKSCQIGFLMPFGGPRKGALRITYFSGILDSMVSAAFERGYNVSIHLYDVESPNIDFLRELVLSRQVDALVLSGLPNSNKAPAELRESGIPLLVLGNDSVKGVPTVTCDPREGIRQMIRALKAKGYRRLWFSHGNLSYFHAEIQKKTLLEEIKETGLELAGIIPGDYSRRSGYSAAKMIIRGKSDGDAVFLSNDRMASGFYRYCLEKSITIPDEIGVVGSDDDEEAIGLFPTLSTIHQPRREMGEVAVAMVVDYLAGKKVESVKLSKNFIERESI